MKETKKRQETFKKSYKLAGYTAGTMIKKIQTYNGRVYEDDKPHEEDRWKHQTKR